MSAKLEVDSLRWNEALETQGRTATLVDIENLFRNADENGLVKPLREAHQGLSGTGETRRQAEQQCLAALAIQEQWNAWMAQREQLRNDIRRGREVLDQVRRDLALLRSRVEEWATFERHCGRNPLQDYLEEIVAK